LERSHPFQQLPIHRDVFDPFGFQSLKVTNRGVEKFPISIGHGKNLLRNGA
jgi:hypothetical protein